MEGCTAQSTQAEQIGVATLEKMHEQEPGLEPLGGHLGPVFGHPLVGCLNQSFLH